MTQTTDQQMHAGFVTGFAALQADIHATAKSKGWWDSDIDRGDGTLVALMHSELSEALEAMRNHEGKGRVAEELADTVIRIMDYAEARGLDVAGAIVRKNRKNKGRAVRHGGKAF